MSDLSAWSKDLRVDIGGRDVVNHAGAAALRLLADRSGLAGGLSRALARRGFVPVHDRGRVLADTASLRDQSQLYGPVASDPALWRALNEIGESQRCTIGNAPPPLPAPSSSRPATESTPTSRTASAAASKPGSLIYPRRRSRSTGPGA